MTNMGVLDGVFRFTVGVALLAWSYGRIGPVTRRTWAAGCSGLAGAVFALTGLFRHCPLYAYFKIDSCAIYPGDDEE